MGYLSISFVPRFLKHLVKPCVALLLIASFLATHASAHDAHERASAQANSFVLPQPKALQDFNLLDHRGSRFDNGSLQGRWTFVLFGYTHCPDICPTTLSELREVRHVLASEHGDIRAATVFVSIDPQRDTPVRLSGYVKQFGEDVRGVVGAPASIKKFADQFRVRYAARLPNGRSANYVVDHTASVALVGPDGNLHAVFMLPLRPSQVAADVARMHSAQRDVSEKRGAK